MKANKKNKHAIALGKKSAEKRLQTLGVRGLKEQMKELNDKKLLKRATEVVQ